MKLFTILTMAGLALSACGTSAEARPGGGDWVLNPARCPDLVEDRRDRLASRRDERVDWSDRDVREDRRDRRESGRDRQVSTCPASAFDWRGPRYNARFHPARPGPVAVHYSASAGNYGYYGPNRTRIIVRF